MTHHNVDYHDLGADYSTAAKHRTRNTTAAPTPPSTRHTVTIEPAA